MSMTHGLNLSAWLLRGSPSVVALGVVCGATLHYQFGSPWISVLCPVVVLMVIQTLFYWGLYRAVRQFEQRSDPRFAVVLAGVYGLTLGVLGMWFAGHLGIVPYTVLTRHYVRFSVLMIIGTILWYLVASLWKSRFDSK